MVLLLRSEALGLRPQFQYVEESQRPAIRSSYSPANVRVRAIVSEPAYSPTDGSALRLVKMSWPEGDEGQKVQLRRLWAQSKGGVLPMDYTPPGDIDANAFQVTFVPDSLSITRTGLLTYSMRVEALEAR